MMLCLWHMVSTNRQQVGCIRHLSRLMPGASSYNCGPDKLLCQVKPDKSYLYNVAGISLIKSQGGRR